MELSGGGFTPFGKVLSAAIALGGIAAQMEPRFRLAAGLIVSKAVYRPWSLLTCAFAADNLLGALAFATAALFLSRIVEPLHGARELAKFLAFTLALSSACTVAVVTCWYYATLTHEKSSPEADHAGDILFRPLGGFEAGAAALLVAVKQMIPENEVALLGGALKFRAKHLAPLFALGMTVGSLVLGGAIRVVPFVLFGTYFGWAFLRFVQTRNGVRGDLSEEFRLASFFPQPLQPPVDRLAQACTRLTGLGDAAGSAQHQTAWRAALGGGALPGSDSSDAARRRERGAKALEERLGLKRGGQGAVSAAAAPLLGAAASSGGSSAAAPGAPATATPEAAQAAGADLEAGGTAEDGDSN